MTEKVKPKIEKVKKIEKKKNPMGELTDEEREAVTIVFHQFETGLREGTIFTKVHNSDLRDSYVSRPLCASSTRDFPYQEVAQLIMVIHVCMDSHALAVKSNLGKILRKCTFNDCPPETSIQISFLTNLLIPADGR